MAEISRVFEISVEAAGDYIFTPAGVAIIFRNQQFQVYSENAQHNFLRRVLSRHPWEAFDDGVVERGTSVRLREVTDELNKKIGFDELTTEAALEMCYRTNPRQLFFLANYLTVSPSQANMPPS